MDHHGPSWTIMDHLKQTPFSNLFYTSTVMFLWNKAGILDAQADHSASSQQVGGCQGGVPSKIEVLL